MNATRLLLVTAALTSGLSAQDVAPPKGLLCEWRGGTPEISDPCPEFCWEAERQAAYRVVVYDAEPRDRPLWDSVWIWAAIVGLLSVEWFLRKRIGLP